VNKHWKQGLITLAVVFINFGIDRVTKLWAVEYLKGKGVFSFLADTIRIVYAENEGAFLSLGSGWGLSLKYVLFIILPLIFCLYGIYYTAFKVEKISILIVISTIIGGGLGNIYDRIFYGFRVVDFLNFGIGSLRTGILNVADLSVTFGALILFWLSYREDKKLKG